MNTKVAGGTKKTPYEVVFGQPPRITIMPGATVENEVINEEDLNFELNPAAEDTVESQDTFSITDRPTPKPRKADPTHEYPGQRKEQQKNDYDNFAIK